MADEWKTTKLGDIAEINPDSIDRSWPHSHIRYIDISSVGVGQLESSPQVLKLGEAPSRAKRIVKTGDTVLSTVRPNRRSMFFVSQPGNDWIVSTGFAVLRPKSNLVDPRFLYACVFNQQFTDYLVTQEKGAAYPAVSPEDIANAEMLLPPLREQQAIACILGALDDKIELNRRRNRTLEGMARAIFQSWFVDFDPVKAKAAGRTPPGLKPELAALFPDSFQDSPLGQIPTGWLVGTLSDFAGFVLGGDWGKDSKTAETPAPAYCIRGADIPSLQSGGLGEMPIRYLKESSLEKRSLRPGDLVIEISGGSPTQSTGRPVLISKGLLSSLEHPLTCSNFCRLFRPTSTDYSEYLYLLMRWNYDCETFLQYENGTTGIKNFAFTKFVESHTVQLGNPAVVDAFARHIRPQFIQRQELGNESRTLAALRDALLPKLISGELRVPDAERIVGRAV